MDMYNNTNSVIPEVVTPMEAVAPMEAMTPEAVAPMEAVVPMEAVAPEVVSPELVAPMEE